MKKKKRKKKNNRGFTLVELLAVIAIVSILVSAGLYFSTSIISNTKSKSYQVTINNVEKNANTYIAENNNKIFYLTSGDGSIEYQCVTVGNLIEMGYLDTSVVDSPIDTDGNTVNEDDYIYIERNAKSKTLIKSIYDIKHNYGCSDYVKASGDITFVVNPSMNDWSQTKNVIINYKVKNRQAAGNYQYVYSLGNSTNEIGASNNPMNVTVGEITTVHAKILDSGSVMVHKTLYIEKIDTTGPSISLTNDLLSGNINGSVKVPITVTDTQSGVNSGTIDKTDFKVTIGGASISLASLKLNKLSETTNTVKYELEITDSTHRGELAVKVLANTIFDKIENGNAAIQLPLSLTMNKIYKVTANANSGSITLTTGWTGSGSSASKDVTYGETYGTLPTVARKGFTLDSWWTASSGGTKITTTTKVSTGSNHPIYPHWKANPITLENQTLSSGVYGTAYTSNAFTAASNGTDNYVYTIKSGAPTGASINSTARKITLPNTTDPGTYKIVINVTDSVSGASTSATMTIVITKKTLTPSINTCSNKVYDGGTSASCTLKLATINGTDVVTASGTCTFADKNVGNGKTITCTSITISGSQAGKYLLSGTSASKASAASITKLALTPSINTCNNKVYDGGTSASCTIKLATPKSGDTVTASGTCNFADKNVGNGKSVTCTSITLAGSQAGNYSLSATSASKASAASITKLSITPSINTCSNKVYDGGTSASCTIKLTGPKSGDTVTASGTCTFADKNVGNGKTITCKSITLSGSQAGNYSLSTASASKDSAASITKLALTPSINTCSNKVYDGGTSASCTIKLTGPKSGDTVTASGTCTFADKNVGNGKTVTCKSITLSGAQSGNYSLSATSASKASAASITKLSITPSINTCNNKVYDGNTKATCTLKLATIKNGDTVTVSGTCTFADKNAGNGKTVTCNSITIGGAQAGNYSLSGTSASKTSAASITKATCTAPTGVTISNAGKVTWNAAGNATSYQISINNSSYTAATNGIDYKSTITAANGSRTVYVRSVCDSTNYTTPSTAASSSINVYKITLTKGTGISAVSGAGNYIKGSTASINATLTTGYKWSKWTQTSGGAQVTTTQAYSAAVNADWNYTAVAIQNTFTVTASATGGSIPSTTGWTGTGASAQKSVVVNSTYGTLPTPTKTGYTFDGWYTAESGGSKILSSSTVTTAANHTIYAHWAATQCIIQFNLNTTSGVFSVNPTSKTVNVGAKYGTLPEASANYSGYTLAPGYQIPVFEGWWTTANGGTKVTSNTSCTNAGTYTVYAHYVTQTIPYPEIEIPYIPNVPETTDTPPVDVNPCTVSSEAALACMQANSEAWFDAKAAGDQAEMDRLHAENDSLSQIASPGSTYSDDGYWSNNDEHLYDPAGGGKTGP